MTLRTNRRLRANPSYFISSKYQSQTCIYQHDHLGAECDNACTTDKDPGDSHLHVQIALDAWLAENSAVYDKKTLLEIYKAATTPRFGFLCMNLMAHDPRDMFFFKFEARIIPRAAQETDAPQ